MKKIMLVIMISVFAIPAFTEIIGFSVQGREITVEKYGPNTDNALIIMGGIHGKYEGITVELMIEFKKYFSINTPNISVYIVENINPDSFFVTEPHTADKPFWRFNQNRVDLNRNWFSSSWKSNATYNFNHSQKNAGGISPMSEPEVKAVSSFILRTKATHNKILIINYHNFVVTPGAGIAQPSYAGVWNNPIVNDYASNMAKLFISSIGQNYKYLHQWTQYEVPGEFLNWAGDNDISAIDIELPNPKGIHEIQTWGTTHFNQNLIAICSIIDNM